MCKGVVKKERRGRKELTNSGSSISQYTRSNNFEAALRLKNPLSHPQRLIWPLLGVDTCFGWAMLIRINPLT